MHWLISKESVMASENDLIVDIIVPNQTRYLSLIGRIGEDIAKELDRYTGNRETLAYHINLVLTEAMTNAIRHANDDDPEKKVRITISISDNRLVIQVEDNGQGFDINLIPEPDFARLEDSGRGIFMIKALMDSVMYQRNSQQNGNILIMTKQLV